MKDGKKELGEWFDINRIEITDENPVMKVPDFTDKRIGNGDKGSADKPIP